MGSSFMMWGSLILGNKCGFDLVGGKELRVLRLVKLGNNG